jgi:predicted DNA-binding protein YlxM (UPF0122 family)
MPYLTTAFTIKQQYNLQVNAAISKKTMAMFKKSLELRRKIHELMYVHDLSPKEISARLGVSTQTIYYCIRQEKKENLDMKKIESDLADALTRENFYKDLIERLSRRLLWKTELRLPMPLIKDIHHPRHRP